VLLISESLGTVAREEGIGILNNGGSPRISHFAPIETRARNQDLNAGDQQSNTRFQTGFSSSGWTGQYRWHSLEMPPGAASG
jgi:hypothetical protein